EGDGRDDFDGQFHDWLAALWPALGEALSLELGPVKAGSAAPQYEMELVPDEPAWPFAAAYGARLMTVMENRELQRPNGADPQEAATRAQIAVLAEHNECPPEKARLLALSGSDPESAAHYRAEVLDKHKSLLDLLEEFPAVTLPFPRLLELLPPLRPRYYSI